MTAQPYFCLQTLTEKQLEMVNAISLSTILSVELLLHYILESVFARCQSLQYKHWFLKVTRVDVGLRTDLA